MPEFTVIGARKVYRVRAKSIQALTQAAHAVGMKVQGIYEDREPRQRRR